MLRFLDDLTFSHHRGEADRDRVILPARRCFLDLRDKLLWREIHARIEFPRLAAGNHQFDVGPANVDDEDLLLHRDFREKLFAEPKLLEEAALLRLRGRGGRGPAFHDFQSEKAKEGKASEFEIEPEILRDLGNGPDAVELRC